MPAYKIASGDLKTTPLLRHVATLGKPMIVSTGGATMDDVLRAYDAIDADQSSVLLPPVHRRLPAPREELNLSVIQTYRQRFPELVVGLSDHENGIAMAVAAYVLGARVIEKHLTLNHTWKGTDHAFSLEPMGMRKLVRDLRRAREALGTGIKCPLPSERGAARPRWGRSLWPAGPSPSGMCSPRTTWP